MAGRWMSVGETTDASALSDQVKRYKPRAFRQPSRGPAPLTVGGPKSADGAANAAHERLTSKCISVIVDNFEDLPMHEHVPAKCVVPHSRPPRSPSHTPFLQVHA